MRTKVALFYLIISLSLGGLFAGSPKLCLTMIVKNEEKIIERCLSNAKDVIDYVSICDTGSTDNTVQIIEQFLNEHRIPGKVHKNVWVDFGHNRTLSVESAKKMLADLKVPLEETYLLLLDADMNLKVDAAFKKESLLSDVYLVAQKNPNIVYYNTRLIRASLPWECVGVTHEYWSCKAFVREEKLTTLSIDDCNDGGCKSDKFERDIKLLTKGLEKEPDNERYMFYLAQSYKNLGKLGEAIQWFDKHIERKGWHEEIWYSMFMKGECFEAMDQWEKALNCYLEAYQFNPKRAETLQKISKHYRLNGSYYLAYLFAKEGSRVPYPKDQMLFVSYPVYEYLFDEDISIAAYYTAFREDGFEATCRLMLNRSIPSETRTQAYKNILFYAPNLKNATFQPIEIDLPLIREGFASHYNPMNPSILKTETGYDLICRTVNYMQIRAEHFQSLDLFDPTNTAKTRNFLVRYDKNFQKLSSREIVEELPRMRLKSRNIEGLEDCRLFSFQNSLWFLCTTLDTNATGQPQMSLCKLSKEQIGSTIQVEQLIPLSGPDPNRCEKNWLPFVKDDELHIIYSYDPFIIYKPDLREAPNKISYEIISKKTPEAYDFSRFSGSAPPIKFDEGFLLLVHETVYDDHRNYLHRFVFLDRDLNIEKISKPFTFLHKGIEYCCGMAIDHSGKNLLMGVGIEDREAYLCTVPLETVRSLLMRIWDK